MQDLLACPERLSGGHFEVTLVRPVLRDSKHICRVRPYKDAMKTEDEKTAISRENVEALLAKLKKDSLARKLVEVASNAEPQGRQAAVAATLQAKVKALSKAFACL